MEIGVIAVLLMTLASLVLMVLALKIILKKAKGKECVFWVVALLLLPIIAPIAALINFKNKPNL